MTHPKESNDLKRFTTLRARAALSGVMLHCLDGDLGTQAYIATRWAMAKQLDDLNDVETWLDRVTGHPVKVAAI